MSWSLVFLALVAGALQSPEEAAEKSALAWLSRVDAGEYEGSWKDAAALFRGAVSQEDWKRAMAGARQPLGKLLSRTVKSRTYRESLPGAPDGKYVVIEFDASFEKKKTAIETVTPMQDPDGSWRVSGYFIK